MHNSIKDRFSILIENDVFKVSSFLDPFFNISAFEPSKREDVKNVIKSLVKADSFNENIEPVSNRNHNYVLYSTETEPVKTSIDSMIDDYIKVARKSELSALENF